VDALGDAATDAARSDGARVDSTSIAASLDSHTLVSVTCGSKKRSGATHSAMAQASNAVVEARVSVRVRSLNFADFANAKFSTHGSRTNRQTEVYYKIVRTDGYS